MAGRFLQNGEEENWDFMLLVIVDEGGGSGMPVESGAATPTGRRDRERRQVSP